MALAITSKEQSGLGDSEHVFVLQLSGAISYQIGGHLRRELRGDPIPEEILDHRNNHVTRINNKLFAWHTTNVTNSRIYEFDGDAYHSDISSLSGLFTAGETINGGTSSATAIVVDASVTGDDFIIIKTISGAFVVGETITGASSGATATVDTNPIQDGDIGLKGEWKVVHTPANTLDEIMSTSGLYTMNVGGETKVSGFYLNSAGTSVAYSVDYEPTTNTWSESNLGAILAGVAKINRGNIVGDTIYLSSGTGTGFANPSTSYIMSFNPTTQSVGLTSYTGAAHSNDDQWLGNTVCEYKSRIFNIQTITANRFQIIELSGGTWTSVFFTDTTTTNEYAANSRSGGCMFVMQEVLYCFWQSRYSGTATSWACIRLHIDSSDNIVVSNFGTTNGTDNALYADFFFPSGMRSRSGALSSDDDHARFRSFLDLKANDPDGAHVANLYYNQDLRGGATILYGFLGPSDLSLTYTFNATTTVTSSGDPTVTDSLVVGDWIGIKTDKRIFRITAFSTPTGGTANSEITIVDTFSITIPSGATTAVKEGRLVGTELGVSALGEIVMSESSIYEGNRNFLSVSNNIDIAITGVAPALAGENISFKLYSNGGATTVQAEFFFGPALNLPADTKCTLSSPSAGSISGKAVTGLTADNGVTEYTVKWLTQTDSVVNGETRMLVPKVFI
jgi:hypothetical protein